MAMKSWGMMGQELTKAGVLRFRYLRRKCVVTRLDKVREEEVRNRRF